MKPNSPISILSNCLKSSLFIIYFLAAMITNAQSPGGISNNLAVWYKANSGTGATNTGDPIAQWQDNAALGIHVTQGILSKQPTFNSNNINYNPSLNFDGVNDDLRVTLASNAYTSDFTLFSEAQLLTLNPEGAYFHNHNTTTSPAGDNDLTSFQLDSDGSVYRYRNNVDMLGMNTLDMGTFNNNPRLFTVQNQNSGLNTVVNTFELGALRSSTFYAGNHRGQFFQDYFFGINRLGNNFSNNNTAELIIYSSILTPIEKNKIETYLAVKYGQTLDNTSGGTAGDYTATTGDIIWDASVNSSYHNNIIGIGREDSQNLYQKQSHTLQDSLRIYRGVLAVSNSANTASFNNFSYALIGNNNGQLRESKTEMPSNCTLSHRLEREWKIQRTSLAGTISIDIVLHPDIISEFEISNNLCLLVDDDGDFSNGGTTCYFNGDGTGIMISCVNHEITVSNITTNHVPDNATSYITLASLDALLHNELETFEASCNNNTIDLVWSVAPVNNDDYYEVEKSSDASYFETIWKESGNGARYFEYTDKYPLNGWTYYRLKIIETNGYIRYSKVIAKKCHQLLSNRIKVYPNPFEDFLIFDIDENNYEPIHITILDYTGRIVHDEIIVSDKSKVLLDVSRILVPGMYAIRIGIGKEYYIRKVIKN